MTGSAPTPQAMTFKATTQDIRDAIHALRMLSENVDPLGAMSEPNRDAESLRFLLVSDRLQAAIDQPQRDDTAELVEALEACIDELDFNARAWRIEGDRNWAERLESVVEDARAALAKWKERQS